MALSPKYSPNLPTISATYTTFNAALVLHKAADAADAGDAPDGINWLPAAIFVSADAEDVLEWKDANGNTVSHTFAADYSGPLPFTIAELTTNTTVTSLTAAWNK